jgi:hypothetical protein
MSGERERCDMSEQHRLPPEPDITTAGELQAAVANSVYSVVYRAVSALSVFEDALIDVPALRDEATWAAGQAIRDAAIDCGWFDTKVSPLTPAIIRVPADDMA